MFVGTVSEWNVTSENISKKSIIFFGSRFKVLIFGTSFTKAMASLSNNHYLDLYWPKSLGPGWRQNQKLKTDVVSCPICCHKLHVSTGSLTEWLPKHWWRWLKVVWMGKYDTYIKTQWSRGSSTNTFIFNWLNWLTNWVILWETILKKSMLTDDITHWN